MGAGAGRIVQSRSWRVNMDEKMRLVRDKRAPECKRGDIFEYLQKVQLTPQRNTNTRIAFISPAYIPG